MCALRWCVSRIDRPHGGQRRCDHAATRPGGSRDGGDRATVTAITSCACVLRRGPAHTFDKTPAFHDAVCIFRRFAHFRFDFVNFGLLRARLLSNMHCTATHDGPPAGAGAKFCECHLYRHSIKPRCHESTAGLCQAVSFLSTPCRLIRSVQVG